MTVDTKSKLTVVTQFITGDGGDLSAIKRFYVQGGKVIPNSESTIAGTSGNEVDTAYCAAQKTAFGDQDDFSKKGGLAQMGKALSQGMVLVMSLWDDVSFYFYFNFISPPALFCSNGGKLGRRRIVSKRELTQNTALRQHALARQHLPGRQGRLYPRYWPWNL